MHWLRSHQRVALVGLLALVSLAGAAARAQTSPIPFEIAITPFLPVRTTVVNYQPLIAYLEVRLQRPVTFITAPDYRSFNERLAMRQYPMVITVANSAYLAHAEYGYVPLLRPVVYTRPALVVHVDSTVSALGDLRGKVVALTDAQGIVAMQARDLLREAGLVPDCDVSLLHMANHAAAVNLALNGEAAAAIVSDRAWLQMPITTREQTRVVTTWDLAYPGVVYLASPALPPAYRQELAAAIREFADQTTAGQALMERLGYGGLASATAADLVPIKPYGHRLKRAIEGGPAPALPCGQGDARTPRGGKGER